MKNLPLPAAGGSWLRMPDGSLVPDVPAEPVPEAADIPAPRPRTVKAGKES